MKFLIVTQKVSKKDSVLGFFHRWIVEFAKHGQVTVICLEKEDHELPENIEVLSLGKEEKNSRLKYVYRFYKYIWQTRGEYDAVFVHMNEEYVLMAGMWWRLMGKKVALWRNHIEGTWKTPIAVFLSNVVFCTSPHWYTARFEKTHIMPTGIDIDKFRVTQDNERTSDSILSMGRIDPVKNVDTLVDALKILDEEDIDFTATIAGEPNEKYISYYKDLEVSSENLIGKGKVRLVGAIPNPETPKWYRSHEIFVNMTNSGSLDKTIFSAIASGAVVIISNLSLKGIVPDELIFEERNPQDLAIKLKYALALSPEEKNKIIGSLQAYVESQSIEKTIEKILEHI